MKLFLNLFFSSLWVDKQFSSFPRNVYNPAESMSLKTEKRWGKFEYIVEYLLETEVTSWVLADDTLFGEGEKEAKSVRGFHYSHQRKLFTLSQHGK